MGMMFGAGSGGGDLVLQGWVWVVEYVEELLGECMSLREW